MILFENIYGYKIDDAFYIENIINGEPAAITSDCSITESYYVDIKQKLSWRFFAGGVGNKDARNSTRKGEILKQFIYQCGLKVEELTSKMPLSVKHSSSTYIPRRRVKELFNENGNCKIPSYPTAETISKTAKNNIENDSVLKEIVLGEKLGEHRMEDAFGK